jgi:uncharacterized protein (DUF2336 family)
MSKRSLLDLLDLAHESSSDNRRQLLREVTDLFLEAPTDHSDSENEHFGWVMGRIAKDMEMALRRDLAQKLAAVPSAPHSLIVQLANDEIDVANPVLSQSTVLKDADLIAVAKTKGQEHLAALAIRPRVSALVTDAIVSRADDHVLERIVANKGASFSRHTMEKVVSRAERNERLHRPVLEREDLPADLMQEMFFHVSAQLKAFILQRTADIDPAALEEAFASAERNAATHITNAQRPDGADHFIAEKESRRELNEALLISLLRAQKIPEFVAGLSRLTGIDKKTARYLLTEKGCEGLAIAARAARFDRSTFASMVFLADPKAKRTPAEVQKIAELFDKITIETAQRVIRFWKVRRSAINESGSAQVAAQ